MFDFIKKIKKALDKEPEDITLSKSKIQDFIDKYSKSNLNDVNLKITSISEKIKSEEAKTRTNLERLEGAELKNKKIDPKHIQIMEGNRTAYIQKVTKFLDEMVLPKHFDDIEELHREFNERIVIFNKHTIKAYYVLQEFFSNESRDVALGIKNIDNFFNEFKKLSESEDLSKINAAIRAFNKLTNSKSRKAELQKELAQERKEIDGAEKALSEQKNKKDNFMKSPEYKVYQDNVKKKQELQTSIADLKRKMVAYFLDFDRPMKKYARISMNENVINKYLDNSLEALRTDENLKIIEILDSLKIQIENDKLGLKDKQKQKSIATLTKLDRDFFRGIQIEYSKLYSDKQEADIAIKKAKMVEKIEDFDDKINQKEIILTERKRRLSDKESELSKINPESLNNKLVLALNEMSGNKITLVD